MDAAEVYAPLRERLRLTLLLVSLLLISAGAGRRRDLAASAHPVLQGAV